MNRYDRRVEGLKLHCQATIREYEDWLKDIPGKEEV